MTLQSKYFNTPIKNHFQSHSSHSVFVTFEHEKLKFNRMIAVLKQPMRYPNSIEKYLKQKNHWTSKLKCMNLKAVPYKLYYAASILFKENAMTLKFLHSFIFFPKTETRESSTL